MKKTTVDLDLKRYRRLEVPLSVPLSIKDIETDEPYENSLSIHTYLLISVYKLTFSDRVYLTFFLGVVNNP
jgi:hypothetical protein